MDKDTIPGLGWAMLGGRFAAHPYIVAAAEHQKNVIQVMTVLPGKHRYESVEAAIRASGFSPGTIYRCLAANECSYVLTHFYEALGEVEI